MSKYFGTDGIRGEAYKDITESLAKKVGQSLGVLKSNKCIVGMDTRESSPTLKNALIEGLKNVGFNVYDLNVTSTPSLMYLTKVYDCVGVMITASHNPYQDNGIKVINRGRKTDEKENDLLEASFSKKIKVSGMPLKYFSIYEYTKLLKQFEISSNLKIAFDFSNGSLSYIYKDIIDYYHFRKAIVGAKPNGRNINEDCGSQSLDLIKRTVNLESCDYGFAFDGDGDRVIAIDKELNVYDGDSIIYAIANYYKSKNKLTNNVVVLSEDANPGLAYSLKKNLEVDSVKSIVGDRFVKEKMNEVQSILGGETSGHIILNKYIPTGDGLFVALFLLSIITETKKSLKELTEGLKLFEVVRKNYPDFDERYVQSAKFKKELDKLIETVKNPESSLVLVRKSGTQHLLRVSVSTGDDKENERLIKAIEELAGATK